MKKKIFSLLLMITLIIGLTGCKNNQNDKSPSSKSVFESTNIKIDGAYIDESYQDDNLKLLYIFYTVKANDTNLKLASTSIDIKVNGNNNYDATNLKKQIPKYSDYYYSDFLEDIYVSQELKMVSTYKVASGDLIDSKDITLVNTSLKDIDKIKINTDDIKSMENIESICKDIDKNVFETKYNEEQALLASVDSSKENEVKSLINGYYFEPTINVGQSYLKYKIEFSSPNNFSVSNAYLSNSGTYEVKAGYITLTYKDSTSPTIYLKYTIENGDITISNFNSEFGTYIDYNPNEE